MSNGNWIKLHRQLLNSAVFDNEKLLKVWIWCLLKATYIEYEQLVGRQLVTLKPGQFIFGRRKAAVELGIAESSVRDYMKLLESMGNITIKSTNKYSVITLCQWDLYQSNNESSDSKPTTSQTTDGQQINTNKKYKKVKNKDPIPKKFGDDHPALKLAKHLKTEILNQNPETRVPSNLNNWATEADRMLRLDKRNLAEAISLITWAQNNGFWRSNILSMSKFRKQYDKLRLQKESQEQRQSRITSEQDRVPLDFY